MRGQVRVTMWEAHPFGLVFGIKKPGRYKE